MFWVELPLTSDSSSVHYGIPFFLAMDQGGAHKPGKAVKVHVTQVLCTWDVEPFAFLSMEWGEGFWEGN